LSDRYSLMKEVEEKVQQCSRCPLFEQRNHPVPGEGDLQSPIVFVGEGPGAEEDKSGRPFVGKAGNLLVEILKAVSLRREDVYITNIVKCRPPQNRTPTFAEMETCFPFLQAQLCILQPRLIVTLGSAPLSFLLQDKNVRITRQRGVKLPYKGGMEIFPMFHPSYLLRNASKAPGSPKFLTWKDIQEVRRLYDTYREEN